MSYKKKSYVLMSFLAHFFA